MWWHVVNMVSHPNTSVAFPNRAPILTVTLLHTCYSSPPLPFYAVFAMKNGSRKTGDT